VTGELVKLAEQASKYLTWLGSNLGGGVWRALRLSPGQKPFRVAVWMAGLWTAYVAGAACGALGDYAWNCRSLVFPMSVLAALVTLDVRKPLALAEEREELQP
jgi:hypothetical protein